MLLANFLSKSKPINFIFITGLFFVYYLLFFISGNFSANPGQLAIEFTKGAAFFLVVFFTFNFIITKNKLTRDNSYAFLLLVICLGLISAITFNDNRLYVHLILLFFLRKAYSLRNRKMIYKKGFDAGLLLGLAFLMQPKALVFVFLLYAALFLYDKIVFRSLIIPVIGFAVPVLLYFSYCFFVDKMDAFYAFFRLSFSADFSLYTTPFYKITFGVFLLFILVAVTSRSGMVFSVNNKFKRSWVLLLLHLLVGTVFAIISSNKNGTELIAVSIPTSIIIANWLQFVKRKWLIDLIFVLLIGYSFVIHFII